MSGAWELVGERLRAVLEEKGTHAERYRVVRADPLVLEGIDSDTVLEDGDDDVVVDDMLRTRMSSAPLEPGDTVLALRDEKADGHEWHVLSAVTKAPPTGGGGGSDPNTPTAGEKAALAGTSGAPGAGNRYVTNADPRNTDARAPTGAAGGALTGTYPSPTLAGSVAGNGLVLAGGGTILDVAGTANRIVASADAVDISVSYAGQSSISTLGTITTGTWQGAPVDSAYIDQTLSVQTLSAGQGTIIGTGSVPELILKSSGTQAAVPNLELWAEDTNLAFRNSAGTQSIGAIGRTSSGGLSMEAFLGDVELRAGGSAGDVVLSPQGSGKKVYIGSAHDTTLYRLAAGSLKTDGIFTAGGAMTSTGLLTATAGVTVPALTGTAYRSAQVAGQPAAANYLLTADANPAFRQLGDGKMEWGAGGASTLDTNLYRKTTDTLKSDDFFVSAVDLVARDGAATQVYIGSTGSGAGFLFGSASDANLYRTGAGALRTDGTLSVGGLLSPAGVKTPALAYGAYRSEQVAGNVIMNNVLLSADAQPAFQLLGDGKLNWGAGGATPPDTILYRASADKLATDDDFLVNLAGKGVRIKEGTNAKMGTAVLVGGTVVVNNTSVTATSRIQLTCQVPGGTPGFLRVSARTAGTSFTILSSSATDTSTVGWVMFEPA